MDTSSIVWAFKAGLIVSGPICFGVGTLFAISTSFSVLHRTWPKLLGWLGGIAVAFATGAMIAPALTPFFWPRFGIIWCAGFGWLTIWGLVSIFGGLPDESNALKPKAPIGGRQGDGSSAASRKASPLRFRDNSSDGRSK